MSFLNKKNKKIITILDIGSSSIGGAIVSIEKGKPPIVLHSVRKQIVVKSNINFSHFFSTMSDTLEFILIEIKKESKVSSEETFCVLSSFWYTSVTNFIKIDKDIPFVITSKMIDDLIDKEVSIVNKDVIKQKNISGGISRVIDVQNIQIKLNGYETNNPYNKKAKLVEIALFVSIGSEKTIKLIENKVSKVLHNDVQFSSFSLVSFVVIRDIFAKNNFLFLDITGEVTDVSIIKNNVLIKSESFPLGKNFLIRRIASGFNTSVEEAESLFSMFNSGNSDVDTNNKLKKILGDSKKEWRESFIKVLKSFSTDLSIPNSIFITADNEIQEWFTDAIKTEEFSKFTFMNDEFEIEILNEKLIGKFCSVKRKNTLKDLFIMIEAIFIERIINNNL